MHAFDFAVRIALELIEHFLVNGLREYLSQLRSRRVPLAIVRVDSPVIAFRPSAVSQVPVTVQHAVSHLVKLNADDALAECSKVVVAFFRCPHEL